MHPPLGLANGFRVSHRKIALMGPTDRRLLNKLVLGELVTVQKQFKARIRAGIHNLVCGKVAPAEVGAYIESLKGSINYLGLFNPSRADKLRVRPQLIGAPARAVHELARSLGGGKGGVRT